MESKRIDEKRLQELFEAVIKEAENVGVPISRNLSPITINRRAKSRFGCCRLEKKVYGSTYHIEVSEKILCSREKLIKQVIAHELLHTCKGCMNHGEKWKAYAAAMNAAYGYNITRVSSDETMGLPPSAKNKKAVMEYKYVLVCQKCGAEILRKKRCKVVDNPSHFRCGKCGGTLKLM